MEAISMFGFGTTPQAALKMAPGAVEAWMRADDISSARVHSASHNVIYNPLHQTLGDMFIATVLIMLEPRQ